jgi:hypothetical protein
MYLSEKYKFVPVMNEADISGGADGDSICMKNYHSATFLVFSETTNWGAGPDIKIYSGATDGTKTTAMTVNYRYGSAAVGSANSDVLTDWQTAASEIAMGADHEGYLYVIEVEAREMTDGHDWLTISVDDDASATGGGFACLAILTPRYPKNIISTALA